MGAGDAISSFCCCSSFFVQHNVDEGNGYRPEPEVEKMQVFLGLCCKQQGSS